MKTCDWTNGCGNAAAFRNTGENGFGGLDIAVDFKGRRHWFASDPAIPAVHFQQAVEDIVFIDAEAKPQIGCQAGIDELFGVAGDGAVRT